MNNNKSDINSYLNSNDLTKYLNFLGFDYPFLFRQSEIDSIDHLFRGNNHTAIILLNDHLDVGHFVVLRKDSDESEFSYFDCLGEAVPEFLTELFSQGIRVKIDYLTKPLMGKTNNLCGKYCISFILAGNISVLDYYKILKSSSYSPDYIINNLYRINYTENQISHI